MARSQGVYHRGGGPGKELSVSRRGTGRLMTEEEFDMLCDRAGEIKLENHQLSQYRLKGIKVEGAGYVILISCHPELPCWQSFMEKL